MSASSIRFITSTFPTSVHHRGTGFCRTRSNAIRCRGTADARRIPAHLWPSFRGWLQTGERTVIALREREKATRYAGLDSIIRSPKKSCDKRDILEFLIGAKRAGKTIVGYGAPAKATLCLTTAAFAPI